MTNSVLQAIHRIHNIRVPRAAETLFHYTSIDTFEKIIESRRIRFRRLPFMNDPQEVMFGVSVVDSIAKMVAEDLSPAESAVSSKFLRFLNQEVENLLLDVYSFSMSQHGDRLSQWRSYGVDGEGCSIGFDRDLLLSLSPKGREMSFFLTPLAYKEWHQDYLQLAVSSVIEKMCRRAAVSGQEKNEFLKAFKELLPVLLILKSEEYQEEYEWRLLIRFDSLRSQSVVLSVQDDFIDVPLEYIIGDSLVFKKVIIGPCVSEVGLVRDAIARKARISNLKVAEFQKSSIQYRNKVSRR